MFVKMDLENGKASFINPKAATMLLPYCQDDGNVIENKVWIRFIGGDGTVVAGDIEKINETFKFVKIKLSTGKDAYINSKTISGIMPWYDSSGVVIDNQTLIKCIGKNTITHGGICQVVASGTPEEIQLLLEGD